MTTTRTPLRRQLDLAAARDQVAIARLDWEAAEEAGDTVAAIAAEDAYRAALADLATQRQPV